MDNHDIPIEYALYLDGIEQNYEMTWKFTLQSIYDNRAYHAEINRKPYKAMFGCKAKIWITKSL